MNEISPFENTSVVAPPPQQSRNDELGQEDFMTLMITQFRNQDPFKPMENGDFLGQLAQFGTVNGIEQLNSSFGALQSSIQSEQALQAANLVGHDVLAVNDIGFLAEEGKIAGAVDLESSASNIQVDVVDASGQLIRRFDLGVQEPGLARFAWDGRNEDGELAGSGHYQLVARVSRGTSIEQVPIMLESKIESVNLGGSGQGLTLNLTGGDVLSFGQVRRIL
ncbi:MAG: flagellar hook assembly protein FlgD [Gammaproteobacteria bacterium]|nr:flagellar hook assembly protein FlgD [Gammaproteobacteria bacterium]